MVKSSADGVRNSKLARGIKIYRDTALISFNLAVLFVLANIFLHFVFSIRGPEVGTLGGGGKPPPIPAATLAKLYPDLRPADRDLLIRENWTRPYVYQDYVMFKERSFHGTYVNVSDAGFRHVANQGPWPPAPTNLNIFVFGGSTTFGYGLADDQTIAANLQQALSRHSAKRVCTYNFGTAWYYSTQERLLFEKLLADGFVPHIAVFVDGLNDITTPNDSLAFSPRLSKLFDEVNYPGGLGSMAASVIDKSPTGRLIRSTRRKLAPPKPGGLMQQDADASLRKYRQNTELIEILCQKLSISPVFVWQPSPAYKYDRTFHLFPSLPCYQDFAYAYGEMAKLAAAGRAGPHFVWAADLQENEKENLYVDSLHYGAKLCRKIADHVVQTALDRQWLASLGVRP